RLASVLDDLLHLVHILSGRPELERESFRLGRLVEGAIAETIRFFETRGQTLRCHISAELELFADPTRLEQVLVQLLSTASRFAREGGTVELRASRDDTGTAAVLTVRADGTELADSHQEQIFDPLLRSPGERSSKEDVALGLGLAVAKRVSELHGGEIEFRAGPDGKGSEFVVRIPLGDRPKAGDEPTIASPLVSPLGSSREVRSAPSATSTGDIPPSGYRVLVVDDNPEAALGLQLLLEDHACDVRLVTTGCDALAVAKEFSPHACL